MMKSKLVELLVHAFSVGIGIFTISLVLVGYTKFGYYTIASILLLGFSSYKTYNAYKILHGFILKHENI